MINLHSTVAFSEPRDSVLVENKKDNEDSFLVPIRKNLGYLLCVADGLGSYHGALEASRFTCNFLENKQELCHDYLRDDFARDIKNSISEYILNKDPIYIKAATTLSVCFFDEFGLSIWHVGDCRVYIKIGRKLVQITNDHTQYQRLIDKKIYTKKELEEKDFGKSVLTTAISLSVDLNEEYLYIPLDELRREYGDEISIIIMSDGAHHFWDRNRRFGDKTMSDIIKFSNALKRRIERIGPIDDYTVVAATFCIENK